MTKNQKPAAVSPNADDVRSGLKAENEQLHEYVRSIYQLLIAWFTFWVTVNIAAIGVIAADLVGNPRLGAAVAIVGGFFIFQNALSVPAMLWVHRSYGALQDRADAIAGALGEIDADHSIQTHTIVIGLYRKVLILLTITMLSLIVLWSVLVVMSKV